MGIERLRECVARLAEAHNVRPTKEPNLVARCRTALQELVAADDWLPEDFAKPHPQYYQQYLLYCDPLQRFSLVSFVWGPGQATPVHDHTVWGLIGMLRGAELEQPYTLSGGVLKASDCEHRLEPGMVGSVSPSDGTDVHRVRNAHTDRTSISIHLYGANIGAVNRHAFDVNSGTTKNFVSGYANDRLPNLWHMPPR